MNTVYDARLLAQETAAAAIRANIRDVQLGEARVATEQALLALQNAELERNWHGQRLTDSRVDVSNAFDRFDAAAEGVRRSIQALSETTAVKRKVIDEATDAVIAQFEVLAELARTKLKEDAAVAREVVREESDDARALLMDEREQDEQNS